MWVRVPGLFGNLAEARHGIPFSWSPFDGRSAEGEAQPQLQGLGVRAPRKEPRNEQHSSHGKQDPRSNPLGQAEFHLKTMKCVMPLLQLAADS